MPAVARIKTYTKTRKSDHKSNYNYSSSGQNSFLFPITGASTAIDSLLAKNIEKRNSSIKETTQQNTRSGKKSQKEVRLLANDSFDLTINTTFEKLLKAPDFQPVNYCNLSVISGNSSTGNSPVKKNDKPMHKVQKTYERKVKTNILSLGKKIKNQKINKKNLLKLTRKVQKTLDQSPDVYVARKFTPIASTSKLMSPKMHSNAVFQPGLRHCMQAQNSPNFLAASTPLLPRHLRSCHDFSISPITAKKQLNFNSGWKSLFESDSLPSTSIKSIKDSIPGDFDDELFLRNNSLVKNDLKFKAIPIVIIEDGLQLNRINSKRKLPGKIDVNVKKMFSPRVNLTRNSFSKYTKNIDKLLQSPYIDLTRCSFTEYLNKKKQKQNNDSKHSNVKKMRDDRNVSVDHSVGMNLRSRSPTKNMLQVDGPTFAESTPDKQTCVGQIVGQTCAGQTLNGQKEDGQTSVGQTSDGQTSVEQTSNKQKQDGQTFVERTSDEHIRQTRRTRQNIVGEKSIKFALITKPTKKAKTKNLDNNVHGIGLRTRSHRLNPNCDNADNISEAPRKARTMSLKTKTNNSKNNWKTSPHKPTRRLRSASVHLDKTDFNNENSLDDSIFIVREENPPKIIEINDEKINDEKTKRVPRKRSKSISHTPNRLSNIKEKSVNISNRNKLNDESIYIENIIKELKKPLNTTKTPVSNPVRRSSRARRKSVLIDEENYSDWGEFQRITQNKFFDKSEPNTSIKIDSTPKPVIKNPSPVKRQTRSTSASLAHNNSITNTIINISDSSDKSLFSSMSNTTNVDIIDNTINEAPKQERFITTRRGSSKELKDKNFVTRRRGYSNTSEVVDLNHQTISLHEWERFSQSNISTINIDDVEVNETINQSVKSNNSVISDTFAEEVPKNVFLKPGKQWFRSLSILRRTNIHSIHLNNSNKGRKWRDSVCAIFDQQDRQAAAVKDKGGMYSLFDYELLLI